MSFITYAAQKTLATFVRATVPFGPYNPKPDEVIRIPCRDIGRTVKAHLYKSKVPTPSPVLINFHGSGFIVPLHGSDDEFARRVVKDSDYAVLDCSYRLAPEYPHPAALTDVEDAIKWVLANPQDFDPSKIALSGFSAGANMILVAASTLFPKGTFERVIALYPPTDLYTDSTLKIAPDQSGKPLPGWMTNIFSSCYMPPHVDRKGPTVSPTYTPIHKFPNRMLFITCACDNLCAEAETLASKIGEVPGNHVVCRRMDGCDHAWDKQYKPGTPWEEAKDEAYDLVVTELKTDIRNSISNKH